MADGPYSLTRSTLSTPLPPAGVLVSMADGRSTLHAMGDLQSRGTFFIEPGAEVYAGMVVGESTR